MFEAFQSGTLLGRFQLLREVGRGGMGVVLHARDPVMARDVAIKVIGPKALLDPNARARFQREATAASRLKHPNLATVYELGEQDGQLYLVMEWIEGQTLSKLLQERGRLPIPEALEILRQLVDGLDYLHRHGVVHRDVKTANILISPDKSATLVDFGLALVALSPALTDTGQLHGTPRYMSPEQIRQSVLDGRSDLYSLALVFYEMLCGVPAFPGDNSAEILTQQLHAMPAPVSEHNPAVGTRFDPVMARAMAKDPKHRYASSHAWLRALEKALEKPGGSPWRRLPAFLFLSLAVLAMFWVSSQDSPPTAPAETATASATPASQPSSPPGGPSESGWKTVWTSPVSSLTGLSLLDSRLILCLESGLVSAISRESGEQLWTQKLSGPLLGVPLSLGETILVATDSGVCGLDAATGKRRWSHSFQDVCGLSLAADDTLYVAQWMRFSALDASTGEELWARELPNTGLLLPICPNQGALFAATQDQGVLALDRLDYYTSTLWKAKCPGVVQMALAADQGLLIVAQDQFKINAYSSLKGTRMWSRDTSSTPVGLATQKGVVVVTCSEGEVLALSAVSGDVQWKVGLANSLTCGPAIDGSSVLIPESSGQLRCLDLQTGLETGPRRLKLPGPGTLVPVVAGHEVFVGGSGFVTVFSR